MSYDLDLLLGKWTSKLTLGDGTDLPFTVQGSPNSFQVLFTDQSGNDIVPANNVAFVNEVLSFSVTIAGVTGTYQVQITDPTPLAQINVNVDGNPFSCVGMKA